MWVYNCNFIRSSFIPINQGQEGEFGRGYYVLSFTETTVFHLADLRSVAFFESPKFSNLTRPCTESLRISTWIVKLFAKKKFFGKYNSFG